MRCPSCSAPDDKVVDSRAVDDGSAIRRRRECLGCGSRFTTFERLEEAPLSIVKRSGVTEPFDRDKIAGGVRAAAKNRPLDDGAIDRIAAEVEEAVRLLGPAVPSEAVGLEVLQRLQEADHVAYLRFASVYNEFDDLDDFRREVRRLQKR